MRSIINLLLLCVSKTVQNGGNYSKCTITAHHCGGSAHGSSRTLWLEKRLKNINMVIMDTSKLANKMHKELNWQQRRFEMIKKYISDNLSSDLKASVVSHKFDMSTSTLHHQFQKYLLSSYQQYVEQMRMEKAMEITRSGKRIRIILAATGYKNRTTFYDAFKRTFKDTPGAFRYAYESNCPE